MMCLDTAAEQQLGATVQHAGRRYIHAPSAPGSPDETSRYSQLQAVKTGSFKRPTCVRFLQKLPFPLCVCGEV